MRKFYLLLAEYMDQQRLLDSRTFKLLAIHMKDPPDPGVIFPSLRVDDEPRADDNDDAIFRSVAASLTQYGNR